VKKYYKDYSTDAKETNNGKVTDEVKYTGDYYKYQLSNSEYKRMRTTILLVLVAFIILYVGLGFLNNSGSRCFYVLLPYICMFLPLVYLLRAYYRIPREVQKIEYAIYDKSYLRLKNSVVGMIATSITTALGDIIFIIRNASEIALSKEIIFFIANIMIAVISILLLRYHNRIVCDKQQA
jgi:c-di-AMP phosphodiesterase-like protein